MKQNNDEMVLKLKQQIEDKKKKIKLGEKFSPVTNCSISMNNLRYNLHACSKDILIMLLVNLNVLKKSAEELGYSKEFEIDGYSVDDWMEDVISKLANLSRKEEQEKLHKLEIKLDAMLSSEKKTELELAEIAKLLE